MGKKNIDKKITNQMRIELLLVVMVLTSAFVLLFDAIPFEYSVLKTTICESLIFVLVALPSLLAYKLQGGKLKSLKGFRFNEIRIIAFFLAFRLIVMFVLDWTNIVPIGMAKIWHIYNPVMYLIYYVFVVAICEEFIFRIYVQETLEILLGSLKKLAPVFAGVIFGAFHLITGNMTNAIVSAILGIVWGYARYAGLSFMSLVFIHGLSNYLLYMTSIVNGIIHGV